MAPRSHRATSGSGSGPGRAPASDGRVRSGPGTGPGVGAGPGLGPGLGPGRRRTSRQGADTVAAASRRRADALMTGAYGGRVARPALGVVPTPISAPQFRLRSRTQVQVQLGARLVLPSLRGVRLRPRSPFRFPEGRGAGGRGWFPRCGSGSRYGYSSDAVWSRRPLQRWPLCWSRPESLPQCTSGPRARTPCVRPSRSRRLRTPGRRPRRRSVPGNRSRRRDRHPGQGRADTLSLM